MNRSQHMLALFGCAPRFLLPAHLSASDPTSPIVVVVLAPSPLAVPISNLIAVVLPRPPPPPPPFSCRRLVLVPRDANVSGAPSFCCCYSFLSPRGAPSFCCCYSFLSPLLLCLRQRIRASRCG